MTNETTRERCTYALSTMTDWVTVADSIESAVEQLARRAAPYAADGGHYRELGTTLTVAVGIWWPVDAPEGEIRVSPTGVEVDGDYHLELLDAALVQQMLTRRIEQIAAESADADAYNRRRDAAPDSEFCLDGGANGIGCEAWLGGGEECGC